MASWVRASAVQMWGPSSNPQHHTKSRVWPCACLYCSTVEGWRQAVHNRACSLPASLQVQRQRVINILFWPPQALCFSALAHIETHTKKRESVHLNMGCWGAHSRKENGLFQIPAPPPNSPHFLASMLAVGSVWKKFLSAGSLLEPWCLGVWTPETKLCGNSRPAQERAGVRGKILIWDLCGNRSKVVGRLSAVVIFRPHVCKWQGLLLLGQLCSTGSQDSFQERVGCSPIFNSRCIWVLLRELSLHFSESCSLRYVTVSGMRLVVLRPAWRRQKTGSVERIPLTRSCKGLKLSVLPKILGHF